MHRRLVILACLVLLGLSLEGCTKCGFLWDEGGRACRSDRVQ